MPTQVHWHALIGTPMPPVQVQRSSGERCSIAVTHDDPIDPEAVRGDANGGLMARWRER